MWFAQYNVSIPKCDDINGSCCVEGQVAIPKGMQLINQNVLLELVQVWNFEFRCLGQMLNSFCGPSYVSLEVLSIKCWNLQMLPNLSNEMREPNTGVATSWLYEKYNPKLRSASTTYVSSAVTGCHSFTYYLEKILPPEFFNCAA